MKLLFFTGSRGEWGYLRPILEECKKMKINYKICATNMHLLESFGMSVKEMVDIFKKVNDCDFQTVIMPRRDGDLEQSVLKNVSLYMTKLYDVKEYLKI